MMQYKGAQPTQKNINSLIEAAQNAQNEHIRSKVLGVLWEIVGGAIMGNMVGKSYRMNSDFDMMGESPVDRQANLASDGYLVFYRAVMSFDQNLGVPFLAYVAQKIGWKLATEKRNNSKRTNRVVISSKMQPNASEDSAEEDAFAVLLERTPNEEDVEGDCFRKDAILKIKRLAASDPKVAAYFETCQEACNQGYRGSDAEVARSMGCTRTSTGIYRKKLVRLLAENGLDFNTLVATAA